VPENQKWNGKVGYKPEKWGLDDSVVLRQYLGLSKTCRPWSLIAFPRIAVGGSRDRRCIVCQCGKATDQPLNNLVVT
jgi:hypothetical protein